MKVAPIPENESERQKSLESMGILSTPRDPELDRITRLAERIFKTEFTAISLLDGDRQFFKSRVNLSASETSRDISFCGHAIMHDAPLVVGNAINDERFSDNPLVAGAPHIRSYVGVPLSNAEGFKLGTLCIIDSKTRNFSDSEIETLKDLAHWVETVLALRYTERSQKQLLADLDAAHRDVMIDSLTGVWNRRGLEELLAREMSSSRIKGGSAGIFMLDIDHFKKVNDSYGHLIGDKVIQGIAAIMSSSLRDHDIVGRFGGEEFVCILPGLRLEQTMYLGYKLCDTVRDQCRVSDMNGNPVPITVSVGATWISNESTGQYEPHDILRIADEALYEAKESGRDTVRYRALDTFGSLDDLKD
ncbi:MULTISPECIES: sensor domain-containing diguanylate cyclase [Thalassospira]|uniref:sensor domain-containing diguanylate cyclase n=1 Tax=Thalassospira TaxID=168934 RepID=UPI000DED4779|nr:MULTISPECIES: sensor domain-containing diguanylate cyclase [Thalassospira]MBO9507362.1 sensor domain-containing diguanylate cyclase [Thalassospira sp. A3_1]